MAMVGIGDSSIFQTESAAAYDAVLYSSDGPGEF